MSLLEKSWWPGLVDRLRLEPLAVLAREVGVTVEQLCEALASVGANGPAQMAPWWPEARRLLKHTPVREIARRFHTNPRRIRRAAARAGVRVGGREVAARGLLDLMGYREQLGRVPDWRIAHAAGVSIEAVQGERRRHHIPPFRPPIGYKQGALSADEEAWILGPVKPRRERMRADSGKVNIVRRPALHSDEKSESRPPEPVRPAAREVAEEGRRRIVRPVEPQRGGRAPIPDSFFNERERKSVDELLAVPRRSRDGRQRIVRVDSPEPAPRLPEPLAPVRKPRARKEVGWRRVDEAVVAAVEEAAALEPVVVVAPPPAPERLPVVRPRPPVASPSASRWQVQSGKLTFVIGAADLADLGQQLLRLLPVDQLATASLARL